MLRLAFFILILLFSQAKQLFAQDKLTLDSTVHTTIANDSLVKLFQKKLTVYPNQTELAIALIDQNETQYWGLLKDKNTLNSITNQNAIFEIGSISKVFTATLLSHLVTNKKVTLDQSIVSLLPFTLSNPPEASTKITLQMLSNHTSGLPRLPQNLIALLATHAQDPYAVYTRDLLHDYLKTDFKTTTAPGKTYAYSNLGAGLLGDLLASYTNQSYESLLQDYIFKPLQMHTSSSVYEQLDKTKLVNGLQPDGTIANPWRFKALAGAGAIRSTIKDLSLFAQQQWKNNPVYQQTQQKTFTVNNRLSMGLGWHLLHQKNKTLLFHNGGTGGFTSCMIIDTQAKKAVVVLSNISAFHPNARQIDGLCNSILKSLY